MIGERVRQARIWQGLSQKQLARTAGLDPSHVSHIECGRRDPSCINLRKLAEALEVSADFLLELRD